MLQSYCTRVYIFVFIILFCMHTCICLTPVLFYHIVFTNSNQTWFQGWSAKHNLGRVRNYLYNEGGLCLKW
jgi:hypothetical protein